MLNKDPHKEINNRMHDDPSNWKLGIFYFNKNDKRIFPPKRSPFMGWTVNFANPSSVLIMIALIGLIIFLSTYFK